MKRPRSNFWLYLMLNVLVSAATTLGVLYVWDTLRPEKAPAALPAAATSGAVLAEATATQPGEPPTPRPTPSLPPADQVVIQVVSVVAAGDLDQEMVLLKRVGEGNVRMAGWRLEDGDGNVYTFPEQPDLTLYKDGAVIIYTKTGDDTATEVYWGRSSAVYSSGETIRLYDVQNVERAVYTIP